MTKYEEKRRQQLKDQMIDAIKKCDKENFVILYQKSLRYMTKTERTNLYIAFLSHMNN